MPAGAKDKVSEVIVRQPDYMKAVDAILADTPVATWKEYLTFGLISEYADGLSAPFADSQFEFNGRVLAGRQQQQPRWKRGVTEVEQALGEPVGRLYIEKYFKPEAKSRMDALIRNLLAAFKVGIDELEWMSPQTKLQAQAKLAKYRLKIAYPDQWRDFSALEVKPGDHVGNLLRFRAVSEMTRPGRALASRSSGGAGDSRRRPSTRRTARPTTRSPSRPASCSRPSSTSMPTMRSTTARSAR